jgi:1-deoxyxylulose-5-phosphate synthase
MRYLHLSGIEQPVSILGLGTGTRVFTLETYSQAAELLDSFLAAGGNCIDAAHIYGFGASERTLGRWLRERATRGQVVLIDKGCHPVVDPENLFGNPWEPRVTPQAIHADLAESLERLQTDSIDVYLLHRDDENIPVGPLVDALNEEQVRGTIRAFGASNWHSERVAAANAYAAEHGLNGFVVSSPQFSFARPTRMYFPGTVSASQTDLAWHARQQFPMVAWSALSAGYVRRAAYSKANEVDPVAQTFMTDANFGSMQRVRELAAQKGTTLAQIALAYVLHQSFPVIALIGPTTRDHLNELLSAVQVTLDDSEMAYLERG